MEIWKSPHKEKRERRIMLTKPKRTIFWAATVTICSVVFGAMWRRLSQREKMPEAVRIADGFDGVRAFADLKQLVDFGPRPAGSKNLGQARQWIVDQLRNDHLTIDTDSFVASTPVGSIPMTNIVAEIPGASPSTVIVAGHYDTKRMTTPFVGANDGASSAAFLLELARVLIRRRNKLSYWLVFFDGEEAVRSWSASDSLYGSRHFALKLSAERMQGRVKAAIVVDMIADAHLKVRPEARSTPWLNDLVWNEANRLGYQRDFLNHPRTIDDDHLSFLKLGIPAVDLIDLDYGPLNFYWHTRYDIPDRCSPTSLAIVGAVVLQALSAVESRHPCATLHFRGENRCTLPTRSFGVRPLAQGRRSGAKSIKLPKKQTEFP